MSVSEVVSPWSVLLVARSGPIGARLGSSVSLSRSRRQNCLVHGSIVIACCLAGERSAGPQAWKPQWTHYISAIHPCPGLDDGRLSSSLPVSLECPIVLVKRAAPMGLYCLSHRDQERQMHLWGWSLPAEKDLLCPAQSLSQTEWSPADCEWRSPRLPEAVCWQDSSPDQATLHGLVRLVCWILAFALDSPGLFSSLSVSGDLWEGLCCLSHLRSAA